MKLARLLVLLLVPALARPSHGAGGSELEEPEAPPPLAWSMAAGLSTALVPLAVGGGIAALAATHDDVRKRAGFDTIMAGLALAPIVSHLVAREWKRAGIFGAVPLAAAMVGIGIIEGTANLLDQGTVVPRITFGAALAVELVATGVGLADSLAAGERYRRRRAGGHPIVLVPTVGSGRAGLSLGGLW